MSAVPIFQMPKGAAAIPKEGQTQTPLQLLEKLSSVIGSLPDKPTVVSSSALGSSPPLAGAASLGLLRARSSHKINARSPAKLAASSISKSSKSAARLERAVVAKRFVTDLALAADVSPDLAVTHAKSKENRMLAGRTGGRHLPGDADDLDIAFLKFCGSHDGIDCAGFERMCKQCLLENHRFTSADAYSIFEKAVQRGQRYLDKEQFRAALRLIAVRKGVQRDAVHRAVMLCANPPEVSSKGSCKDSLSENISKLRQRRASFS